MNKLGAHQSVAGGYHKALERIVKIGGGCLQIFSSSPRDWSFAKISDENTKDWFCAQEKLHIAPVYFHASYLVNLAFGGRIGVLSKNNIINEMKLASTLNIKGSIIHLGSFKSDVKTTPLNEKAESYKILVGHIGEILEKTPANTLFIIENAANRKIGQRMEEIGQIIKDIKSDRVKVCLDTCHLFCAGHNMTTALGLDSFLEEFDKKVGLERLEAVHINDSRDPAASSRDRHANIGQGTMGLETFRLWLNHPQLKHLPFIIETPGFKDEGPDKKNLDILKSLVK